MIQDIQKKVNEMYTDWKATGGFGNHTAENDTKWIEVNKLIFFALILRYLLSMIKSNFYI
jgi:hypothetical protein